MTVSPLQAEVAACLERWTAAFAAGRFWPVCQVVAADENSVLRVVVLLRCHGLVQPVRLAVLHMVCGAAICQQLSLARAYHS